MSRQALVADHAMPTTTPRLRRHGDLAAGAAAAVVTVAVWAVWLVAMRHATSTVHLPPEWLAVMRYLPPAIILAPAWWRTGLLPRGVSPWLIAAMVVGGGTPFFLVTAIGVSHVTAAEAAVLLPGTMPLCVALLAAIVLKERIGLVRAIGFALVAASLVLIGVSAFAAGGAGEAGSRLIAISGAALWAVFTIAFRRSGIGPFAASGIVAAWSLVIALPLALATGFEPLVAAGAAAVGTQVVVQGLMSGIVSMLAYAIAVSKLGVSRAAAVSSLTLPAATLLAIPVLGEWPGTAASFGIAISLVGVVLASGAIGRRR